MVGIAAFSVPSPDFGPAILAAPLWALSLLFYWRALGERRRGYWFLLALVLGLLVLASYAGLILFALMVFFTPLTPRGRAAAFYPEPWLALVLLCIVVFPHALWRGGNRTLVMEGIDESVAAAGRLAPGVWLCFVLVLTHLGLALLVMLASGWPRRPRERAPEIERNPVEPLARLFIYMFAIAPALVAIAIVFVSNRLGPLERITPVVVLSGLAVVLAAGDRIMLYRERLVSSAWFGLLFAPPALVVLALAILPWLVGIDLRIMQPANAEGQFYADIFQRRTGRPLAFLSGDPRLAPLIALAAPSRPHVYFAWAPHRSPWASPADFRTQGGILVWPAADNSGTPPATLRGQFPDMVAEVPRSFPRTVQGVLPLIRLGWSMLRPAAAQ
jgi:hypothetical protein